MNKTKKTNLWNQAKGKTKATINYIENLEEKPQWTKEAQQHYQKTIKQAKDPIKNANQKLTIIGYRPNQQPKFIEECWNL